MKISFVKIENDKNSFKFAETLGLDVRRINDFEKTDEILKELVNNKYDTIVISNEVAGFSESILKKYNTNKNLTIIIAPSKK